MIDYKIILVTEIEDLDPSIEINTLSHFNTKFIYLKKWMDIAKDHCPEDVTNLKNFFKRIDTWDNKSFKFDKFSTLWTECNMEDITGYRLK
jgi:hypothetical protein